MIYKMNKLQLLLSLKNAIREGKIESTVGFKTDTENLENILNNLNK